MKQPKHKKTTTPYDSSPYVVTGHKGTLVTAKRNEKENLIIRNSSHFKLIDDSRMTGVELDDESDNEIVNEPMMPPMRSDHPPNITEPTPTTTAVGNRQTPPDLKLCRELLPALYLGMCLTYTSTGEIM